MISFGPVPSRRLGMSLGINNIIKSLISQKLIKSTLYKGKRFYIREYH